MEPKYKVGDKVHIVDKLLEGMPASTSNEMLEFQGKEVEIIAVYPDYWTNPDYDLRFASEFDCATYRIKDDENHWTWTSPMFKESYNDDCLVRKYNYYIGDSVKLREDLKPNYWYGGILCDDTMARKAGKLAIIVRRRSGLYNLKFLDESSDCFYYSEEMFDNVIVDETPHKVTHIQKKVAEEKPTSFSVVATSITDFLKSI